MKKIIGPGLFALLILALLLMVVFQTGHRNKQLEDFASKCSTYNHSHFAAERAHAVMLKNKTVVSIRLDGEKNFSPPGGHLEANETPKQALVRELKEELGITVEQKDLKPYRTYCEVLGATKTQRTFTFFLDTWGAFNIPKTTQVKWVTQEFQQDTDADTELIKLLGFLQSDNRIQ